MMDNKLTFIFSGRSGSGKGTQVELLQNYVKEKFPDDEIFHYYSGDNFREFINGESYSSELAREIMEKGTLHPNFLAVWLWASSFVENLKGNEHMFIDGSPRALVEAEALDSAMKFYKRNRPKLINIEVPREVSKQRLLDRKREYDTDESIERRLNWYDTEVMPAIKYYEENPDYDFIHVDGNQSIEDVHKEIISKINI